jgi:hypothetical protein
MNTKRNDISTVLLSLLVVGVVSHLVPITNMSKLDSVPYHPYK